MLNIAIAGLGTVGAGLVRLLQRNADLIAARAGGPIAIKVVSARDKNKKRDCDLSGLTWVDDPRALAQMPGIDVVVEVIGGAEGPARELAEAALKNGKHYVTANKALLAAHGASLARLAESSKKQVMYEAAVAGGIPVIKALREGLAANRITAVRGIINGTCNYMLTRMREAQLSFEGALAEAGRKGYADIASPGFDIDGQDAACKLSILAALAFGTEPDLAAVRTDGIRHITPLDLQFADELGCAIKLLGVARLVGDKLEQRVSACLIPKSAPLASVNGVLNAVQLQGDFVGDLILQGQGAGAEPTASAVAADLIDLARGHATPMFGVEAAKLTKLDVASPSPARSYMRLQVVDKPGVVADISAILRDETISIESLIQRGKPAAGIVPVVITTHAADPAAMRRAAEKIARLPVVPEQPCVLTIED